MGHTIVEVYADNGISGAKGRDKRPAFDRLRRDAARRKFDIVMACRLIDWAITAGPCRLPLRAARARDRAVPAPAGPRHHDAGRQGDVSDARRVCRVPARDHRERVLAGMARAKATGTKSGKPIGRPAIHPARRAAIRAAYEAGGVGLRAVAAQFGVGVGTVRRRVG